MVGEGLVQIIWNASDKGFAELDVVCYKENGEEGLSVGYESR